MSAGFTPDEVAHCSFCGRDGGQSHTENCPAREEEGEYVEEAPSRFDVAAQAIRDGLDRRDAMIAALCGALERLLVNIDTSISSGAVRDSCRQAERTLAQARGDLVDPLERVRS